MKIYFILLILFISSFAKCQEIPKDQRFSIIVIDRNNPRVRHITIKNKDKESFIDVLLCGFLKDKTIPLRISLINNGEPARYMNNDYFPNCAKVSYKTILQFHTSDYAIEYIYKFNNQSSTFFKKYDKQHRLYIVYKDEISDLYDIKLYPVSSIVERQVPYSNTEM